MNLIESWKRIGELLPIEIVLKECLRYGIDEIVLKDQLGISASYGEGTIVLDPNADRDLVIRTVKRRHRIELKRDEVFVWLFYHELKHHVQSRENPEADLNSAEYQADAERFALEKFVEWRLNNRPVDV